MLGDTNMGQNQNIMSKTTRIRQLLNFDIKKAKPLYGNPPRKVDIE